MVKTCPYCFGEFKPDKFHPSQIYCSISHRNYAWKKRNWRKVLDYNNALARKKTYKPRKRKCRQCFDWYLPSKHNPYQKYCGWRCRNIFFKQKNPEKVKQYKKTDWLRHAESRRSVGRFNKNKTRFGGNRIKALERDWFVCIDCGISNSLTGLIVHHIDRNKKNNHMDNLKTLCRSCHLKEHKEEIYTKRHPNPIL